MSSHLSSDRANMFSLREALRRELFETLDRCGVGPKALVWDEALLGRFGLVVDQFKVLQDRQIDKMFMLDDLVKDVNRAGVKTVKNIIFVARPKLELMERIDRVVKAEERRCRQRISSGIRAESQFVVFEKVGRAAMRRRSR